MGAQIRVFAQVGKIPTFSRLFWTIASLIYHKSKFISKYNYMNIHALIDLCLVCEWICAVFSLFNQCDQGHKGPLAFPCDDYEDYDDDHRGTSDGKIHLPVITKAMKWLWGLCIGYFGWQWLIMMMICYAWWLCL